MSMKRFLLAAFCLAWLPGASCSATYGPPGPCGRGYVCCQTGGKCASFDVCGDGLNGCAADACCSPPYHGDTSWLGARQSTPRLPMERP